MEIIYSKDNTKVIDSSSVKNDKSIRNMVEWLVEERKMRKYPITRTVDSYVREWKGHNRLYEMGIAKSHTKDVDLNENNNILEELLWKIIGG